jgi:hypothetical protein
MRLTIYIWINLRKSCTSVSTCTTHGYTMHGLVSSEVEWIDRSELPWYYLHLELPNLVNSQGSVYQKDQHLVLGTRSILLLLFSLSDLNVVFGEKLFVS